MTWGKLTWRWGTRIYRSMDPNNEVWSYVDEPDVNSVVQASTRIIVTRVRTGPKTVSMESNVTSSQHNWSQHGYDYKVWAVDAKGNRTLLGDSKAGYHFHISG